MMNRAILLLMATATALPAAATDWRPVIADQGTLIHLVDAATLPPAGQAQPVARTLIVFAKGKRTDFQAMEMTSEFDCMGNRVGMSRAIAYDDAGNRIPDKGTIDGAWTAIEPDTGYAGLAEVICGKRPISQRKLAGELPIAAARELIGTAPSEARE